MNDGREDTVEVGDDDDGMMMKLVMNETKRRKARYELIVLVIEYEKEVMMNEANE